MTTRTEEAEWMAGRLMEVGTGIPKGTRGRVQIHVFFFSFFFFPFVPSFRVPFFSCFFLPGLGSLCWRRSTSLTGQGLGLVLSRWLGTARPSFRMLETPGHQDHLDFHPAASPFISADIGGILILVEVGLICWSRVCNSDHMLIQ